MNIQFTIKSLTSVLVLAGFLACNSSDEKSNPNQSTGEAADLTETSASNKGQAFIEGDSEEKNALQLAIGSEDHTTLVTAVKAAGVENALVNVGPLTVFAPTNSAFDKIDQATLEDLLKPENKAKLANILVHHVAPSNYPVKTLEKNIEKDRKLYMADGSYLEVVRKGEDLYIGDAKIMASVNVSNGWVHIIDNVLLPNN
ncbi:fasciclin domain-containing protein [Psychroflexus sp. YR1-1]|uniref:Fasciclin domain-containing protein n=1 Tax=Psychroflexus aurantiacus TaxID=2709310 RepID=A0A6B3QZL1_9FLAO|nr:fasciclin domain-containing protein [Psychroflexus aurantiacus]NEV93696.1 fasciclin domain-containing protein [Psychroflexus aurantiacus]